MISKFSDALDFQSRALVSRSARQEALASNIANADTPGYKARDLDFKEKLLAAEKATGAAPLVRTDAKHVTGTATGPSTGALFETESAQPSQDGNTVDVDAERTRFADNAVRYEAALRYLNAQIKSLTTAITG
jgi:flagellar basal-body rod protein FlgB